MAKKASPWSQRGFIVSRVHASNRAAVREARGPPEHDQAPERPGDIQRYADLVESDGLGKFVRRQGEACSECGWGERRRGLAVSAQQLSRLAAAENEQIRSRTATSTCEPEPPDNCHQISLHRRTSLRQSSLLMFSAETYQRLPQILSTQGTTNGKPAESLAARRNALAAHAVAVGSVCATKSVHASSCRRQGSRRRLLRFARHHDRRSCNARSVRWASRYRTRKTPKSCCRLTFSVTRLRTLRLSSFARNTAPWPTAPATMCALPTCRCASAILSSTTPMATIALPPSTACRCRLGTIT